MSGTEGLKLLFVSPTGSHGIPEFMFIIVLMVEFI